MRLLFAVVLFSGCAWTPIVHKYPSGLSIVRGDREFVSSACSSGIEVSSNGSVKHISLNDQGDKIESRKATGCYVPQVDMIYILNNCQGAMALVHELGHREGIDDPKSVGLDWEAK